MLGNLRNEACNLWDKRPFGPPSFWHTEEIQLFVDGEDSPHIYPCPVEISGYEYEVRSCARAIAAGKLECPEMPHAETLHMMGLMDRLRKDWGLRYPME